MTREEIETKLTGLGFHREPDETSIYYDKDGDLFVRYYAKYSHGRQVLSVPRGMEGQDLVRGVCINLAVDNISGKWAAGSVRTDKELASGDDYDSLSHWLEFPLAVGHILR